MIQDRTYSARSFRIAAFAGTCLALAGCGSSGLTTASLLPGAGLAPAAAAAPTPAKPEDPLARPLFVAATSAKAVKCGFSSIP